MKIPSWLKIRSMGAMKRVHSTWRCRRICYTVPGGADEAGTQYLEVTNRRRHLNWPLLRMVFTLVFGDADADFRYACSVQRSSVM